MIIFIRKCKIKFAGSENLSTFAIPNEKNGTSSYSGA